MEYIEALEDALNLKAKKNMLPMQPGDVKATAADISALEEWIGFRPKTSVKEGISKFVGWYKKYFLIGK